MMFIIGSARAQSPPITFAGEVLVDFLAESTEHPSCATAFTSYITGPPNDSMWVNLADETLIEGPFSQAWSDGLGPEIIIHTAFNIDLYEVRLLLHDGSYSRSHITRSDDWADAAPAAFTYHFSGAQNCIIFSTTGSRERVAKLDFNEDFELMNG